MDDLFNPERKSAGKRKTGKGKTKKRRKKWAISNKKLARFGKIVLLFGVIETELNKILVAKLKLPEETKDIFIANVHMGEKMRILRKLAGRDAALLDLLRKIGDVNIRRNRIMHAHWRSLDDTASPTLEALGLDGTLHHQQRELKAEEMKATVKALRQVVRRLEAYRKGAKHKEGTETE